MLTALALSACDRPVDVDASTGGTLGPGDVVLTVWAVGPVVVFPEPAVAVVSLEGADAADPLVEPVRVAGDTGVPVVISDPQSPPAIAIMAAAERVAQQVSIASFSRRAIPLQSV